MIRGADAVPNVVTVLDYERRATSARNRIILSAAELFASQGYRRTTLDDIASAAGIKKATLYHYISSKEELLTEIYNRILDGVEAAVSPVVAMNLSADERLRRMIHAHLEIVARERAMLAVAFQEEAELDERYGGEIRRRKRAYEALFEQVIREGQRAGSIRPIDPRLAVFAVLGMLNWTYRWYRPGKRTSSEIAAAFTMLLETGWIERGASRIGGWPRSESVEEALGGVAEALTNLRSATSAIESELSKASLRLRDGLAAPVPKKRSKSRNH